MSSTPSAVGQAGASSSITSEQKKVLSATLIGTAIEW
jgi:hypothetical protein